MCTFTLSIDEELVSKVKPAFTDTAAINGWLQQHVTQLFADYAKHNTTIPFSSSPAINTLDDCFGAWCADDYSPEDMIRDIDEVCKEKTDFIQEML